LGVESSSSDWRARIRATKNTHGKAGSRRRFCWRATTSASCVPSVL